MRHGVASRTATGQGSEISFFDVVAVAVRPTWLNRVVVFSSRHLSEDGFLFSLATARA